MKIHTLDLLRRACTVAVVLAAPWATCRAQGSTAAERELAAIVAVEDQQGDLAAAERMYRAVLQDDKASPAVKQLATQRLNRLLARLGRGQEPPSQTSQPVEWRFHISGNGKAGPQDAVQDPARIAELRKQAAQLLDRAQGGLDAEPMQAIEWIGEPAVAELVSRFAGANPALRHQLATMLWRIGGPQAQAFLRAAASDARAPVELFETAHLLHRPEMLAVATALLANPDFQRVATLLSKGSHLEQRLAFRIPLDDLLAMAERGDAERRIFVLRNLPNRVFAPAEAARMVALMQHATASTDPLLGVAARSALQGAFVDSCTAGIELLATAKALPEQAFDRGANWPADALDDDQKVRPEVATRLWPLMLAFLGEQTPESRQAAWALGWIERIAKDAEVGTVGELLPHALRLHWVWDAVAARMQPSDVGAILQTVLEVPGGDRDVPKEVLRTMVRIGVPEDAIPRLLQLMPTPGSLVSWLQRDQLSGKYWLDLLAKSGRPEVWQTLQTTYDKLVERKLDPSRALFALCRYAQANPSAEALATLRKLVGELPKLGKSPTPVLLSLLALGDEPSLELIARNDVPSLHPLAPEGGRAQYAPLAYLFDRSAVPPAHRFARNKLEALLLRLRDDTAGFGLSQLSPHDLTDIDDEHVRLLAVINLSTFHKSDGTSKTWCSVALERARSQGDKNGWHEWLDAALDQPGPRYHLLAAMTTDELKAHGRTLRRWAEGGESADTALNALQRAGEPVDVQALLASEDATVARWAFRQVIAGKGAVEPRLMVPFLRASDWGTRLQAVQYFAKNLAVEAVPGLLDLLRDDSKQVREAAAEVLTRIRFLHEQRAHWDRALQGLDASPTAAMEKLLLQARADADKAQRLLAIASLGALGKPEALPFMIEWSNEADSDIAAAAKAAITKIHLEPRR
ncbi:MAG: hypothetical protein RL398_1362 [Planctomycetota bacterium]|jgi:hypothetical protein